MRIFGFLLAIAGFIFICCGSYIYVHLDPDNLNIALRSYQAGVMEGAGIALTIVGVLINILVNRFKN